MSVFEEHVGRTYLMSPPYVVSAAKVDEFTAALQPESGRTAASSAAPPSTAPPTFLAVLAANTWAALFDDPELGLSLSRTVHVDQRFDWVQPLGVGDRVSAKLTIDQVKRRGPVAIITVTVSVLKGEELVATTRSTFMHTDPSPEQGGSDDENR